MNTPTFRSFPGQTTNGVAMTARALPASALVNTRREIAEQLALLSVGGVTRFEAKHGCAADLAGATGITVERVA